AMGEESKSDVSFALRPSRLRPLLRFRFGEQLRIDSRIHLDVRQRAAGDLLAVGGAAERRGEVETAEYLPVADRGEHLAHAALRRAAERAAGGGVDPPL